MQPPDLLSRATASIAASTSAADRDLQLAYLAVARVALDELETSVRSARLMLEAREAELARLAKAEVKP